MARCQRTVVAADLSGVWGPPLLDAGFEVGCRTAWLAEGLFFYLTGAAVQSVLAESRRLADDGSLVAADVFGSGLLTLPALQPALAARTQRGLPPPFATDDPIALFNAAGWPSVELAFPGQPATTYGRSLDYGRDRPFAPDPTMRSYLVVARR